jgi:hypothetical protein
VIPISIPCNLGQKVGDIRWSGFFANVFGAKRKRHTFSEPSRLSRKRMMVSNVKSRRCVYGVDFSGARDAGERIWIARGNNIGEETLDVVDLFQAKALSGSGRERGLSHRALATFIGEQEHGIFGLDFPFSLPRDLVRGKSWEEFVLTFDRAYKSPEEFRRLCRSEANGRELRRHTDIESRTPFSPYNLRLYKQTYFGIRDVLAALVKTDTARILPMQQPLDGKAWVLEICPASTLKGENLSMPYKWRADNRRAARLMILEAIEERLRLRVTKSILRSRIVSDIGGDALDSVIAALATFKALRTTFAIDTSCPYDIEGWVYT